MFLRQFHRASRHAAGASGYSSGFIEHYLVPTIYPAALSHPVQLLLAGLLVLANALDLPLPGWGHSRYLVSHSLLLNAGLIAFGLLVAGTIQRIRGCPIPWRLCSAVGRWRG